MGLASGTPRAQQPPPPKGWSLCSQESCAIALVLLREYERAPSSKSSVPSFQHSRTSGVETILFTASQNLDLGTSSCRRLPQTSRRRISGSVTSLPHPVAPDFESQALAPSAGREEARPLPNSGKAESLGSKTETQLPASTSGKPNLRRGRDSHGKRVSP